MQFSCSLPFPNICRISRDLKNVRALTMYVILTMFVPWPCLLYWPCSCPDHVCYTAHVRAHVCYTDHCMLYWPCSCSDHVCYTDHVGALIMYVILTMFVPWSCSCPDHVCYIDHVRALIMYVIKMCFLKINGVSTITDIIFSKCKVYAYLLSLRPWLHRPRVQQLYSLSPTKHVT